MVSAEIFSGRHQKVHQKNSLKTHGDLLKQKKDRQ